MTVALIDRANAALNRVSAEDIDLKRYMHREERARIIPAEKLAEDGKRRMLLGLTEPGLLLPWEKAQDKVKILPGKLAVWCGWSRHGKSQLVKNVMLHAMSSSEKVCIASLEEEIVEVWCDMARMALDCGDEPSPNQIDEWTEFVAAKLWLYDQQGEVAADKIKAVIRYAAEELHVTQFVVDSLMMLNVDRDDYDSQARLVGELKLLAKDTGCTVHLVAHMRKGDGAGEDKPGRLHDIAGGHEIGSKADYVFNVWRDRERKNLENPDCVLTVEKQRGRVNWIGKLGLNYHHRSRQFVQGNQAARFWKTWE